MLIRFTVENFLSFKDETMFEMLATGDKKHIDHVIKVNKGKSLSLLRAAAFYGANASGKSNLVDAIAFAKDFILDGTRSNQEITISPFRLDKNSMEKPSKFEFTFLHLENIYTYGFVATSDSIKEEWLFVTSNKKYAKERLLFERIVSQNTSKVNFGSSLVKRKGSKGEQFLEFVAKGTRPNQLFLTEAIDRNVSDFQDVMQWFSIILQPVRAESRYSLLEIKAAQDKDFTNFLGKFLEKVGTGIEAVESEKSAIDFDKEFDEISQDDRLEIRRKLKEGQPLLLNVNNTIVGLTLDDNKKPSVVTLKTKHKTSDDKFESFSIEDESEGTQRLIHLLPILFNSKNDNTVYIIDELDRRLHSNLTQAFLKAYLDCDSDSHKGQLIFTTHDTNLLDSNILRNDEVWFVEKDNSGASQLYSLAEFKIRKNLKIEKGYLQGRFGAIPFIGDVCNL